VLQLGEASPRAHISVTCCRAWLAALTGRQGWSAWTARPRREEGVAVVADHNVSSRPPPVGFRWLGWSLTAAVADQRVLILHRREVRVLVP
jgi:hypothetical protein